MAAVTRRSVASAINGLPVARFNGSTSEMLLVPNPNPTGTFDLYLVAQATTAQVNTATNGGVGNRILSWPTLTNQDWDQGLVIGTPTASAFAPQIFSENRTLTTGQAMEAYAFGFFCNPNLSNGGCHFTGDIAEVIVYNRALTGAEDTRCATT